MKKLLLGLILSFSLLGTNFADAQTVSVSGPDLGQVVNNTVGNLRDLSGGINGVTSEGLGIVGEVSGSIENIKDAICIAKGDCKATPEGRFELPDSKKFNTIGENTSLRQYILNVLNFVLSFLGLIAVAALIYAGFLYVTSGGDDSANEKSKKIVIYAVIGILLILASFAIVNTVIRNAGVGTDDRNGVSNVPTDINGDGVIDTPTGGGLGNPNPGNTPNLRNSLVNPFVVEVNGQRQQASTIAVSLEQAQAGIDFGIEVKAFAIIDFGDGTNIAIDTSDLDPSIVRVNHKYGEAGVYNTTVIIQTNDGSISSFNKNINVGGLSAQIRIPQGDTLVNTDVQLFSQGSSSTVGTILSYNWTCTGGAGCFGTINEPNPVVQFTAPGTYQIALELENTLGQTATRTGTINVAGETPVASFNFQSAQNTNQPGEFRFDASNSQSVTGDLTGLRYEWNFDGVRQTLFGPLANNRFQNPGSATVELTVVQEFGGKTLRSETVSQIVNVPSTLKVDFIVE